MKTEITKQEELAIEQAFADLLKSYTATRHHQKVDLITRAFEFAKNAHAGVRRRSGEPYIMHPLAVAKIVVSEIGLGSTCICAALLHDVVEDTDTTIEQIQQEFGEQIAVIVDGLTKISSNLLSKEASTQAENFRKLFATMATDARVVLVKIADRLHNMRTLEFQPKEKQLKIAGETQYIYAPLAYRLGLFPIKQELENLSFKYNHPAQYEDICRRLENKQTVQMEHFELFAKPIRFALQSMGYDFEMQARIKTPYSIWKKMQDKNVSFDEVYDLLAVRIVFKPNTDRSEKEQCWNIYSAVTEIYKPHPERIRDWISTPKANGYEALHVTVMGPEGEWVEVQIRTTRMHDIAERGLAAHWKYKMGNDNNSELDRWIDQIRDLINQHSQNTADFLSEFKLNLFSSEIFVFTPRGDFNILPQGATVLDFAYQLHTELGEHCVGAKVNHALQPLSYKIKSGDQVEIITAENQHPQREWLQWTNTAKAKSRLNDYFRRGDRELIAQGEKKFNDELNRLGKSEMHDIALHRLLHYYDFKQPAHLMLQIGKGVLSLEPLEELLKSKKQRQRKEESPASKPQIPKLLVLTDYGRNKEYTLANCCHPIPGDEVFAYLNDKNMFVVHKSNCADAERIKSSYGKRLCPAEWDNSRTQTFVETIELQGIDRTGVIIKALEIISTHYKCNLQYMQIKANDGLFEGRLKLDVYDSDEVRKICSEISEIPEINYARRIESRGEK